MRAKKRRKATAVQTTPRVAAEARARVVGWAPDSWAIPTGAYTTALRANEAATTPTDGSRDSRWATIIGPMA
jgi:hypothetical protein